MSHSNHYDSFIIAHHGYDSYVPGDTDTQDSEDYDMTPDTTESAESNEIGIGLLPMCHYVMTYM